MKRRLLLSLAAMSVLAMTVTPGHAASASGKYVGGTVAGTGGSATIGTANTGLSGYGWTALPFTPTKIRIVDDTGATAIGWAVCQDVDALPCGTGEDRYMSGCSTGAYQSLAGFVSGADTSVFVETLGIECEGSATTGTITLTNL